MLMAAYHNVDEKNWRNAAANVACPTSPSSSSSAVSAASNSKSKSQSNSNPTSHQHLYASSQARPHPSDRLQRRQQQQQQQQQPQQPREPKAAWVSQTQGLAQVQQYHYSHHHYSHHSHYSPDQDVALQQQQLRQQHLQHLQHLQQLQQQEQEQQEQQDRHIEEQSLGALLLEEEQEVAQASVVPPTFKRSEISRTVRDGSDQGEDPEVVIDSSIVALVDGVLRSEYVLAEQLRPRDMERLHAAIMPLQRAQLVNWISQSFFVLEFDDALLHSVVLSLDRYCACPRAQIEASMMQTLILAVVCTEMKVDGARSFPVGRWRAILSHLSAGRLELESILRKEYEVLNALDFRVGSPTALTFLRELALLMKEAEVAHRIVGLATFLLELTLFDPALQYCRSQLLLAAGALSAGLRLAAVEQPALFQWCSEMREVAFEELRIFAPELPNPQDEALCAEEELLDLWLTALDVRAAAEARGQRPDGAADGEPGGSEVPRQQASSPAVCWYAPLEEKFARRRVLAVPTPEHTAAQRDVVGQALWQLRTTRG